MSITLRQVNKKNVDECLKLELSKEQEGFVAPNTYSVIAGLFYDNWNSRCICNDDRIIGFLLYGTEDDSNRTMLLRYMIDKNYQGKGYGKETLLKLFDLIRIEYGNIKFYTIVSPENAAASKLYEKVGFIKTEEMMWDETLMEIQL